MKTEIFPCGGGFFCYGTYCFLRYIACHGSGSKGRPSSNIAKMQLLSSIKRQIDDVLRCCYLSYDVFVPFKSILLVSTIGKKVTNPIYATIQEPPYLWPYVKVVYISNS